MDCVKPHRRFVVSLCDGSHVAVCIGARNGRRVWEKVAASDLPQYLASQEDLEGVVVYGRDVVPS